MGGSLSTSPGQRARRKQDDGNDSWGTIGRLGGRSVGRSDRRTWRPIRKRTLETNPEQNKETQLKENKTSYRDVQRGNTPPEGERQT